MNADTDIANERTVSTSSSIVQQRPIRKPLLPRDDFDGVDSDDETDSEGGEDMMQGGRLPSLGSHML